MNTFIRVHIQYLIVYHKTVVFHTLSIVLIITEIVHWRSKIDRTNNVVETQVYTMALNWG